MTKLTQDDLDVLLDVYYFYIDAVGSDQFDEDLIIKLKLMKQEAKGEQS